MTTIAVIPARFASTRFPGKPLATDTGKYLIQHVCERLRESNAIDRIIVATDDQRIFDAVSSFGGEARMTRENHDTGTSRVAEVVAGLDLDDGDLILNVQGDEPEIDVASLEALIDRMNRTGNGIEIGTLAAPFGDTGPKSGPGSPLDPNCVKVVMDSAGRALYFSRSLIPFPRDTGGVVDRPSRWLLHLGVYAFRVATLRSLAHHDERSLEQIEALEQLRWLEAGLSITVVAVDHQVVGIDTPEDYAAFVARYRQSTGASGGVR